MTRDEKELFDEMLHDYNLVEEMLTQEEKDELLKEVRATLRGEVVYDTILMDVDYYGYMKRQNR